MVVFVDSWTNGLIRDGACRQKPYVLMPMWELGIRSTVYCLGELIRWHITKKFRNSKKERYR